MRFFEPFQEFGGNSDSETERYHYLNTPFIARFIRFNPTKWHRHIAMRAGLLGCPHLGKLSFTILLIHS